ncbi:hypothetical protein V1291_004676 [Nitrobacteraceae bacterium AZCC 1564]
MSILSSDDHLSPHNPLYYAPRRLRERSQHSSASFAEARSEHLKRPISTSPAYDASLEEAVADALRRPLDPQSLEPRVVHEPPGFSSEQDRRKGLLRVAGRSAVAIAVSAVVAFLFVIMVPVSQDHARQPDRFGSSMSGMLDEVKAAFYSPRQSDDDAKLAPSEFETILASSRAEQPVVTHEQSETLLQQFLQWRGKPTRTP